MQTKLSSEFKGTPDGDAAEAILRKCVHCGFCTATCPTYQLLGDELDGPRGRIYLMKQVLEGEPVTRSTQQHLDRCLTCRNCESTCPSGVQYGELVEIGRQLVDARVERPRGERAVRWLLKEGLTSSLFAPALKLGQAVRPLLPAALRNKVPARAGASAHRWPTRQHPRKMLLLMGCVQPAMAPNINSATARVLDAAGIQTVVADEAGCCGAIRTHLGDRDGGLDDMRRNIDAWWPLVMSNQVEAIVMNASGCGVTVKDYGHALARDPAYAEKAAHIAGLTRDLSELLPELVPRLKPRIRLRDGRAGPRPLAYHPPCTLQHGQQLRGGVETHLTTLGFEVRVAAVESHLCCGSAGTYSVLQPELAYPLRDRKLGHLDALQPQAIVSANVGCIQHLQSGTAIPVRHWVEVLDEALAA
ncbi:MULTISPECIES: glycolate oxidase subunit GlcF [unclassified Rhizobacter]|uniref:glycolate oxidase subunit GlcF n=1 Tax=unclassified Rhizobacter TaxID=2640088 RepID=UPI0006F7271D|nr:MULTISPECIES: glycolate oxidase subunit GlcF [unclassified Rhizobacter]KQU78094.1 glycolate oxidase iron-sulfur subunit [Rhizobacter sp. Root29]KQW15840.1 glycolate oxidase iron-sulfur subunit [Rhizobacter sp. Root1238]KRB24953.1 glycolate oxidase iron-sulfur subunit [Rhizobacter sp. Root16D2]